MTDKHRHVPLCSPASWTWCCCVGANLYLRWEPAVMVSGMNAALLLWGSELLSPHGQHSAGLHRLPWKFPTQPFFLLLLASLNHRGDCMCRGRSGRVKSLMKNVWVLCLLPRRHKVRVQSALFQPWWQHKVWLAQRLSWAGRAQRAAPVPRPAIPAELLHPSPEQRLASMTGWAKQKYI